MTLYHGTTLSAAFSIKEQGLKPNPEFAFDLEDPFEGSLDDDAEEQQTLIHLTTHLNLAKAYARYRAEYERAQPNTPIEDPSTPPLLASSIKVSRRVLPDAKPAVVVVEMDSNEKLVADEKDHRGVVCCDVIPPQRIIKIIPLAN